MKNTSPAPFTVTNLAELKASFLNGTFSVSEMYSRLDRAFGGRIPIFHATDEANAESVEKNGMMPVDGCRGRGFFFTVGFPSYADDSRPCVFKGFVNGEFLEKYTDRDTGELCEDDVAALGVDLQETKDELDGWESDSRDLFCSLLGSEGSLYGMGFYVDQDYEAPVVPVERAQKDAESWLVAYAVMEDGQMKDYYERIEGEKDAQDRYEEILELDELATASLAKEVKGTELLIA